MAECDPLPFQRTSCLPNQAMYCCLRFDIDPLAPAIVLVLVPQAGYAAGKYRITTNAMGQPIVYCRNLKKCHKVCASTKTDVYAYNKKRQLSKDNCRFPSDFPCYILENAALFSILRISVFNFLSTKSTRYPYFFNSWFHCIRLDSSLIFRYNSPILFKPVSLNIG